MKDPQYIANIIDRIFMAGPIDRRYQRFEMIAKVIREHDPDGKIHQELIKIMEHCEGMEKEFKK